MAFERRNDRSYRGQVENKPVEKQVEKSGYDGPILITGMLAGKKAAAFGTTFKEVKVETEAGSFVIPKDVTFLVLDNKGKGKQQYNLFVSRDKPKKSSRS